jgi:hypothetical protein
MIPISGVRFFQLDLPVLGTLEGWRTFESGDYPLRLVRMHGLCRDIWPLSVDEAAQLSRAALVARWRLHARRRGASTKAGPVFRQKAEAGFAGELALGLAEGDGGIYFTFVESRITLEGDDADTFLESITRFCSGARSPRPPPPPVFVAGPERFLHERAKDQG